MAMSAVTVTAQDVLRKMGALPFAEVDDIAPGTSMILAPHPDDETIGCGGLISACCARGRPPVIVAMTDGTGSHPNSPSYPPARLKDLRETEMRAAAGILGLAGDRVHFLELRDTHAPLQGSLFDNSVARIVDLVKAFEVSAIFASWRHDPHCDHAATAVIGMEAARQSGSRLFFYPVWGWLLPTDHALPTEEIHGVRLRVDAMVARKRRALAAHASQYSDLIRDDPHAFRIPRNLAELVERDYEVFLFG
jgi:LmbE family N-acetylglucosaminyl deacetylase